MAKGHITVGIGALIGTVTLVGSILAAYYTTNATVNDRIAVVVTDVAVLKDYRGSTETNFSDIKTEINSLSNKVDALLLRQGIDPRSAALNK